MSVLINPDTEIQTMDPTNQPSIPPSVSELWTTHYVFLHLKSFKVLWLNDSFCSIIRWTPPRAQRLNQHPSQPLIRQWVIFTLSCVMSLQTNLFVPPPLTPIQNVKDEPHWKSFFSTKHAAIYKAKFRSNPLATWWLFRQAFLCTDLVATRWLLRRTKRFTFCSS
jgi:hypothetical protein